jgi:outer membrane protein
MVFPSLLWGGAVLRAQSLPEPPRPQFALQVATKISSATTAEAHLPHTLTRAQAEQMALKNNPRISEAGLLALAQKEVVRETRSAELPSAFGSISAVKAEEAGRVSSGSLTSSRLLDHAGAGVTLSQLVTDFGHTRNLVASSSLQASAAEQSALATKEEVVLAVDLAFYRALEAEATLKVAQSTVSARSDVSQQITALTASKLKSTLDQSFAEVSLSQAQLLVLDAQNQADAAMAALEDVLGSTGGDGYTLLDDDAAPELAPTAESVLTQAMQQRPDLRAQQLTHEADVKYARAQWEQLLPTISATGVAGYTPWAPADGATNYFPQDWYGAMGVNLNVPIFNGFKFHAEAHEADYRAQASSERARQLTDQIARDVRTSWLMAKTARQRMAVTRQIVQQASSAADLAQTRYNLGLSSIVELSQAQLQLTQAQIDDAGARFAYEADLATLRFQEGTQP